MLSSIAVFRMGFVFRIRPKAGDGPRRNGGRVGYVACAFCLRERLRRMNWCTGINWCSLLQETDAHVVTLPFHFMPAVDCHELGECAVL